MGVEESTMCICWASIEWNSLVGEDSGIFTVHSLKKIVLCRTWEFSSSLCGSRLWYVCTASVHECLSLYFSLLNPSQTLLVCFMCEFCVITKGEEEEEIIKSVCAVMDTVNWAAVCCVCCVQAYLSRACYYGLKGVYTKAILNCNEAIKLQPNSVRAYLYRSVHNQAYLSRSLHSQGLPVQVSA